MREIDQKDTTENGAMPTSSNQLTVHIQQHVGKFQLTIDFEVPLGLIALFGSSGAGKSLTLRCLAGLIQPDQGSIRIGEHVLFESATGINLPPQQRQIGYVPQQYALFPHLTVAENILFGMPDHQQQKSKKERLSIQRQRVAELLETLELTGLEKRYPSMLSGGQQQRVALARALAAEPRLLLLDEPFNALDVSVRERLRDMLHQFQRRFQIPIVLVSHDHEEVQQLAETIVALQQGQVVQIGSVPDVFFSPRTPDIAHLVGQHNIFSGTIAIPPTPCQSQSHPSFQAIKASWLQEDDIAERIVTISNVEPESTHWLPLPGPTPQTIETGQKQVTGCIRNDEMVIHCKAETENTPTWNSTGSVMWEVELVEVYHYGPSMRLIVRPYNNEQHRAVEAVELYVSRQQWREVACQPGERFVLEIPPTAIHCFPTSEDSIQKD